MSPAFQIGGHGKRLPSVNSGDSTDEWMCATAVTSTPGIRPRSSSAKPGSVRDGHAPHILAELLFDRIAMGLCPHDSCARDPDDLRRVGDVVEVAVSDEDVFGIELRDLLWVRRDVPGMRTPRHPCIDQNDVTVEAGRIARYAEPRHDHAIGSDGARFVVDVGSAEEFLPCLDRGARFRASLVPRSCRRQLEQQRQRDQ